MIRQESFQILQGNGNDVKEVDPAIQIQRKALFLATTAHELKNIILVITNLCNPNHDTSYASSSDDEDFKRFKSSRDSKSNFEDNSIASMSTKNYISALSRFALTLIDDLNYFSTMELCPTRPLKRLSNGIQETNLIESLDFCLGIFKIKQNYERHKQSIKLNSKYSCRKDVKIQMNEDKLKQVIINLLSNSFKFTHSGKIELGCRRVEVDGVKHIRVSVSDTGVGISQEEKELLFRPFSCVERSQSMNNHGSGLGLFIINEILSDYNSKLQISSEINKGTTFWFDIKERDNHSCGGNSNNLLPVRRGSSVSIDLDGHSFSDSEGTIIDQNKFFTDSLKNLMLAINGGFRGENMLVENGSASFRKDSSMLMDVIFEEKSPKLKDKTLAMMNKNLVDSRITRKFSSNLVNRTSTFVPKSRGTIKEVTLLPAKNTKSMSPVKTNIKTCRKKTKQLDNESGSSLNLSYDEEFQQMSRSKSTDLKLNLLEKLDSSEGEKLKTIRIMICDDESRAVLATKNIINKVFQENKDKFPLKLDIITTENGIECLYKLYSLFKQRKYVDILIIDENMPFLSGRTTAKLLKNMAEDKYMNNMLIYLSTSMDEGNFKFLDPSVANGFLSKPIKKKYISQIIENNFKDYCTFD